MTRYALGVELRTLDVNPRADPFEVRHFRALRFAARSGAAAPLAPLARPSAVFSVPLHLLRDRTTLRDDDGAQNIPRLIQEIDAFHQLRDAVQPLLDRRDVARRRDDPAAKKALPEGSLAAVEETEQGALELPGLGLQHVEVAQRGAVEHEVGLRLPRARIEARRGAARGGGGGAARNVALLPESDRRKLPLRHDVHGAVAPLEVAERSAERGAERLGWNVRGRLVARKGSDERGPARTGALRAERAEHLRRGERGDGAREAPHLGIARWNFTHRLNALRAREHVQGEVVEIVAQVKHLKNR